MNDNIDIKTKIFSFYSEINQEGELKIPKEELKSLREKGFNEVLVNVYGSARDAAANAGMDIQTFDKIKNVQSLPDSVVLDFLKTKGSLKDGGFKNKIISE